MAGRDLFNKDFSHQAVGELNNLMRKQADDVCTKVPTTTADEALKEGRVVQHSSQRDVIRVLFVSQNVNLLNPTKQTLDGYLDVADVFDEVHILVMRKGIEPKQPVLRPHKNVFIYTVAADHWWQLPFVGFEMLRSQLEFAEGFRPDLIVAHDPYESALVALKAAKKYGRATQLQILEKDVYPPLHDVITPSVWRKFIAYYSIPRFASIRTSTRAILDELKIDDDIDAKQLPVLNPYKNIAAQKQTLDLKQKYPQYVFFLLFVGSLKDPSAALDAIDSAKDMLHNRSVCLVLLGSGEGKSDCLARAKALGIETQLVIDEQQTNLIQYLKAANLLIATNVDAEGEQVVVQAAAAGLPMVMTGTEVREDLFEHRESALISAEGDRVDMATDIKELMEHVEQRKHLADQAEATVRRKLFQDPIVYQRSYRASVEEALFAQDEEHINDTQ